MTNVRADCEVPLMQKNVMICPDKNVNVDVINKIIDILKDDYTVEISTTTSRNKPSDLIEKSFVVLAILNKTNETNDDQFLFQSIQADLQKKPIIIIEVIEDSKAVLSQDNINNKKNKINWNGLNVKKRIEFSNDEKFKTDLKESIDLLSGSIHANKKPKIEPIFQQFNSRTNTLPRQTIPPTNDVEPISTTNDVEPKHDTKCSKKKICLIVSLILAVLIVSLVIVAVSVYFIKYHRKNKCINDANEIKANQQDHRFSLKISDQTYFYYGNNKMWFRVDGSNKQKFYEIGRDNQSVMILSASNETTVLTSLCKTRTGPQPKWREAQWESVWASNDGETFFYPTNNEIWFEIKDDEFLSAHTFLNKSDKTVFLEKNYDGHILKLNNSGLFGAYSDKDFIPISMGKWINFI